MIRDTAEAVFADPAFNQTSLLARLGTWLLDVLEAVLVRLPDGRVPIPLVWVIVAVVGVMVLAVLARATRSLLLERGARRTGSGAPVFVGAGGADGWAAAQQFAAHGDYTAAAHALYAALLGACAGRGEIERHESKTIGDYRRDLALRSAARLPRFREFARSYERMIYGDGARDRDGYVRLHGLARRAVE